MFNRFSICVVHHAHHVRIYAIQEFLSCILRCLMSAQSFSNKEGGFYSLKSY